jgi:hypothetical protein
VPPAAAGAMWIPRVPDYYYMIALVAAIQRERAALAARES